MLPSGYPVEESRRLRRTVRDLVALSRLPGEWIGRDPDEVARSLADVLLKTLSLDLVYVRWEGSAGTDPVEVARGKKATEPIAGEAVRTVLEPVLESEVSESTVADPFEEGTLQIAIMRFGDGEDGAGLLVAGARDPSFPTEQDQALLSVAVNQTAVVFQRRRAEERLSEQTQIAEALNEIGKIVAAELDLGKIVQAVTDECTKLTSAEFGAFFYNVSDQRDESYRLYTLSGVPQEAFANFPMPRNTAIFGPTFRGEGVVRLDDVTRDPRFGQNPPYHGMPQGHLPVKSYLAVPVVSRSGEVFGGLFFGHSQAGVFTQKHERILVGAAAQAAIAIENGQLYQRTLESEERFRELAENIDDVFWMVDPRKPEVLYISPAYEEIWGRSLGELSSDPLSYLEAVHPEDRDLVRDSLDRQARGEATTEEYRVIRPDGSLRWVVDRAFPIRDQNGDVYRVAGIAEDITQRKQTEQDLLLQSRVLDSMTEGVSVSDESGMIVYTNPSEDRIFGYGPGELIGQHVMVQNTYPPEENQRVVADVIRRLNTEGSWTGEFSNRRKDGSAFITQARITALEIGGKRYFVCVQEDVTERKRVEKELRDARSLLDTLQQNAPVGFAFVDREFRYVRVNEALAAIDGTPPESALGKKVQDIVPKLWPALEPLYRKVLESEQPVLNQEVTGETPAAPGQARHWLVNYYPVRVNDDVIGIGILVTDITERKRLEQALRRQAEQLAEADRRKDEFLATLAHELRNPLAPIRTGLEVMKLSRDDPARVEEIRETLERQTEQLIALVDDLLDVSRITRGKLELRKCRVKLSDVVQSAVEASKPVIDEARHTLTVAVPDSPITLEADPHRLAQVLSNLLNNAAKYTPEGGHVWLSAESHDGEAVISVKDTGIGIPADMLNRIFEMFAQVDRPIERGYTGLGIGLTLVKSLVEMHRGRVEVQSGGIDQGSEFRVHLPVLAETSVDSAPPDPPSEVEPSESKRRVLVVDDNEAAAKMLSMIVKMLGHEARTAGDGQEGIEMADEFRPDVILMDLGMPRLNGYDAARQIRQQPWGESMLLVALTGWGQDEDKRRTKEAGFDYHLVKPAEPAELQSLLSDPRRNGANRP